MGPMLTAPGWGRGVPWWVRSPALVNPGDRGHEVRRHEIDAVAAFLTGTA